MYLYSPRNPVLVKRTAAIEQMIHSSLSVSSSVVNSPMASPRTSMNIHKPIHIRSKTASSVSCSFDSVSLTPNSTTIASTIMASTRHPFPVFSPIPSPSSLAQPLASSRGWWERLLPSQEELQQSRIESFYRVREVIMDCYC